MKCQPNTGEYRCKVLVENVKDFIGMREEGELGDLSVDFRQEKAARFRKEKDGLEWILSDVRLEFPIVLIQLADASGE